MRVSAALATVLAILPAAVVAGCGASAGVPCGGETGRLSPVPDDGARAAYALPRAGDLPAGWRRVDAAGGDTLHLLPVLGGTTVTGSAGTLLARDGRVVRAAVAVLAGPGEAQGALETASAAGFAGCVGALFETPRSAGRGTAPVAGAVSWRLRVPRPASPGEDAVELLYIARGRAITVVELLGDEPFAPAERTLLAEVLAERLTEISAAGAEHMTPN